VAEKPEGIGFKVSEFQGFKHGITQADFVIETLKP
jgi:hypothetical protein